MCVHVLVGCVACLVIAHVVRCYRLISCVSAACKRISHLWVLAHVLVWFVVGYVLSLFVEVAPSRTTCKAEALLCDKGSTQTSGSQGAEHRNLYHRRRAAYVCRSGARFCKKELGGQFPKHFLHLTQSSHVLAGHPHFAPPCAGS